MNPFHFEPLLVFMLFILFSRNMKYKHLLRIRYQHNHINYKKLLYKMIPSIEDLLLEPYVR